MKAVLQTLAEKGIHPYGSAALCKFEKQMSRYFEREYRRWEDNRTPPEAYGVSSFQGSIAAAAEQKQRSIDVSYDCPMALYRRFLDEDYLSYTCAWYHATETRPPASISLRQAQIDKYALLVERAGIADGQTILDLGCGFGGLSKYLLEQFDDVRVIGVNPSRVQAAYIRDHLMAADKGFDSGRFRLVEKFLDDVDAGDIADAELDRVIIVGMFEHVSNMDAVFCQLARMLKPGGRCLSHFIVSKNTIPQLLTASDTLIGQYFPGGHIWPFDEAARHDRHLAFVKRWFLNGRNYWQTLDDWHRRYWDAMPDLFPGILSLEEVDYWNKYFSLCKAMFYPDNGVQYGIGHYLYEKKPE